MAKFNKCPQCGRKVELITSELIFYKLFSRYGQGIIALECTNFDGCGLKMNFVTDIADYEGETEKLAERWNGMPRG